MTHYWTAFIQQGKDVKVKTLTSFHTFKDFLLTYGFRVSDNSIWHDTESSSHKVCDISLRFSIQTAREVITLSNVDYTPETPRKRSQGRPSKEVLVTYQGKSYILPSIKEASLFTGVKETTLYSYLKRGSSADDLMISYT